MPELRKDPIVDRWVIIATERARRPGNIVDFSYRHPKSDPKNCKFCEFEDEPLHTEKLKASDNTWDVCVLPFQKSFLQSDRPAKRKRKGLYDLIDGYGCHEVVLETPDHIANLADLSADHVELVIRTYALRMNEMKTNERFRYLLAFKNYGAVAGSRSYAHARSHITATPVNPLRVKEKLAGAKKYFDQNKRCVYQDLIDQEKKDGSRVIFETDHFIALMPYAARFLFEVWIIPKDHNCDFADGVQGKEADLARCLKTMLMKFKFGLEDCAYNYMIQTAPLRHTDDDSKFETIDRDFRWHIELMPRLTQAAGFEKGTGFYINAIPPEMAAEYLREVEV